MFIVRWFIILLGAFLFLLICAWSVYEMPVIINSDVFSNWRGKIDKIVIGEYYRNSFGIRYIYGKLNGEKPDWRPSRWIFENEKYYKFGFVDSWNKESEKLSVKLFDDSNVDNIQIKNVFVIYSKRSSKIADLFCNKDLLRLEFSKPKTELDNLKSILVIDKACK